MPRRVFTPKAGTAGARDRGKSGPEHEFPCPPCPERSIRRHLRRGARRTQSRAGHGKGSACFSGVEHGLARDGSGGRHHGPRRLCGRGARPPRNVPNQRPNTGGRRFWRAAADALRRRSDHSVRRHDFRAVIAPFQVHHGHPDRRSQTIPACHSSDMAASGG